MKKYLALALIAALAAFAAPAMADGMTGDDSDNYTVDSNYTWKESDNSKTINSLSIGSATLTMVSNAVVNGANATISGAGSESSKITGAGVNDFYGISSIRDLDIIADKGTTNIHIGAALKDAAKADAVSLTMSGVTSSNIASALQYVKVAPQIVKTLDATTPTTIGSANITIDNATVGHSLFGGPLAINGNKHELAITNSEIVINGTSKIGRAIYAGGGVWGNDNTTRVENARIIVNGGTIGASGDKLTDEGKPTENGYIYGGGLVEASGSSDGSGSTATVGTATIIINGGSVEGVRGGGRIERKDADKGTFDGGDATKVDNVEISVVGDAGLNAIGRGGIEVGGELVNSDDTAAAIDDEVISSVTNAKVTLQNIENANVSYEISGMGADDTAALELRNVNGSLGDVDFFQTVGVDPNTSVSLTSLNEAGETPQIALVGDWRDTSGVQEFNLDEMIKVSGKTADELFSNADSPVYDPAETGITSLTRNADGSFRATVDRPAGTSGGGGGGCSAGFGALALLAALPLIRMRKK